MVKHIWRTLPCDVRTSVHLPDPWRQAPFRKIANCCSPICMRLCTACMLHCRSIAVTAFGRASGFTSCLAILACCQTAAGNQLPYNKG